jgi:hypothetical protein
MKSIVKTMFKVGLLLLTLFNAVFALPWPLKTSALQEPPYPPEGTRNVRCQTTQWSPATANVVQAADLLETYDFACAHGGGDKPTQMVRLGQCLDSRSRFLADLFLNRPNWNIRLRCTRKRALHLRIFAAMESHRTMPTVYRRRHKNWWNGLARCWNAYLDFCIEVITMEILNEAAFFDTLPSLDHIHSREWHDHHGFACP